MLFVFRTDSPDTRTTREVYTADWSRMKKESVAMGGARDVSHAAGLEKDSFAKDIFASYHMTPSRKSQRRARKRPSNSSGARKS